MTHVVIAHGLWMPGTETIVLQRRLRDAGFTPRLFRFHTVGTGLDDNVERLRAFVAETPGAHLVGFSLGGVLAVCLGARPDAPPIGRIVCLGSPLKGSVAARRLCATQVGRRMIGHCMLDLCARAPLPAWQGRAELGIVAGRLGVGLGRLVGGFAAPNDGTVAVAETELEGATAHTVLPVSHSALLFSREVAARTITFLSSGHF